MTIAKHLMTPGDVARALGVTATWVRTLDAELKPIRLESGVRRYDPAIVQRFATKRARAAVRPAR